MTKYQVMVSVKTIKTCYVEAHSESEAVDIAAHKIECGQEDDFWESFENYEVEEMEE